MIETVNLGTIKWLHILNPTEDDLQHLLDTYDFHPLDIEDCRSKVQRPKIDIYDNYYFLILHFPYYDKANQFLKTKEVKVFWGPDFIITIGESHWVVKSLYNTVKKNPDLITNEEIIGGSSDGLLYKILERLMTETLILFSRLTEDVDLINRSLFNKKAEKTIERMSITRRNIILLNTIFKPQLRLFHKFESGEVKGFATEMEEYWGNILDYLQKIWDMVEDYEELIEGLSKTFDSLQANRTNQIMKMLTFFSSVMLPLTFFTGLYGMNVRLPLEANPMAFWIISIILATITGTLILFFKSKRWL